MAFSRWRSALRAAPLLLLIAILAGCGMIPPTPETETSKEVFTLWIVVFAMGMAVFVGVEAFIVYAIFRYRRRDDRLPDQVHGNNLVEVIWTAIPTIIVLILFGLSMVTLGSLDAKASNPGVRIDVTGFQWQWQFHYLDDDADPTNDYTVIGSPAAPPVMVVPVGEVVHLKLTSADVIHSFYVPHFLIKRDVFPLAGDQQPNELEFTVTEAGTYSGQCAEFCGDLHARMTFSVEAMARSDYDTWLAAAKAGETPAPTPAAGETVLDLSADQLAFDTQQLTAPAGQPFIIHFTNLEAVPHQVSIFSGDQAVFSGDQVIGPNKSIDYEIPALDPGEYTFICEIHSTVPTMRGTLTVE
jgi:cytochrome c oxidase subunit 2